MWYLIVSTPDLCTLTYFNKTESAVFLYCVKNVFFQIIQRLQQLSLCPVELVKKCLIYRYSVDILIYSGHSGILGSGG